MVEFNPIQTNEMPRWEKLCERIWEFVRPVLCGCSPWFMRKWGFSGQEFFAALVRDVHGYATSASIVHSSRVDYPWRVTIGDHSSIGTNTWVYALAPIRIGNRCCIGEDVRILTGSHDVGSPCFNLVTKPVEIGDCSWIATGAIILPSFTIGEEAVVAAGAVVTKDVQPWTVVGGNPAKFIKARTLREVE